MTDAATAGWALDDVACVGSDGDADDDGATATVDVQPGTTVLRTYRNAREQVPPPTPPSPMPPTGGVIPPWAPWSVALVLLGAGLLWFGARRRRHTPAEALADRRDAPDPSS